ncbi:MAG: hypothetical protein ABSF97_01770 [Candidatus Sulfotelmatobacter sp.]|jgi:hypothetical protein
MICQALFVIHFLAMKRWAVGNVVLCFIAIHLLAQPYSYAAQHQEMTQPKPTLPDNHKESPANTEASKASPPRWYAPLKDPNWCLVIVAFLTGITIGYQAYEMRRSTNSQKAKERARLSVEPLGFGYADFDEPSTMRNDFGETGVRVTQHGPTKAFNVKGHAAVTLEPSEQGQRKRKHISRLHIPDVIDGGQAPVFATMTFFAIDIEKLQTVWSHQNFIHFFGRITYEDVFGDSHAISFRYIWATKIWMEVPSKSGEPGKHFVSDSGGWRLNGKKKDNYAD